MALGLDQGANGDAWGYDIAAQRVTLASAGLPWPHYFVDLSGIGGSADPASNLVVISACTELAPTSPAQPVPSATLSPSPTPPDLPVPRPTVHLDSHRIHPGHLDAQPRDHSRQPPPTPARDACIPN